MRPTNRDDDRQPDSVLALAPFVDWLDAQTSIDSAIGEEGLRVVAKIVCPFIPHIGDSTDCGKKTLRIDLRSSSGTLPGYLYLTVDERWILTYDENSPLSQQPISVILPSVAEAVTRVSRRLLDDTTRKEMKDGTDITYLLRRIRPAVILEFAVSLLMGRKRRADATDVYA